MDQRAVADVNLASDSLPAERQTIATKSGMIVLWVETLEWHTVDLIPFVKNTGYCRYTDNIQCFCYALEKHQLIGVFIEMAVNQIYLTS